MNLSTQYLGLQLKNPLVVSSSPLSRDIDMSKRLEDFGASAIIMHSLFEEEINQEQEDHDYLTNYQEIGHAEASSFLPMHHYYISGLDEYLGQLSRLKTSLEIPVIASLNGISAEGWIEHGHDLQEAGADAIELNAYYVAANMEESSAEVEKRYIEVLQHLKKEVTVPISMKLPFQFSSVGHFANQLEQTGVDGIALFNRFYQPDIDLNHLDITPSLHLSSSEDSLLALRWIAILFGKLKVSIAATGGIHTAADVIKMLLVGADVTYLCSTLLKNGTNQLTVLLKEIDKWLEDNSYTSIEELKGSMSQFHIANPAEFERANYVKLLKNYNLPSHIDK